MDFDNSILSSSETNSQNDELMDSDNSNEILTENDNLNHIYVSPEGTENGSDEYHPGNFKVVLSNTNLKDNTIIHMQNGTYLIDGTTITVQSKNNISIIADNYGSVEICGNIKNKKLFTLKGTTSIFWKDIIFSSIQASSGYVSTEGTSSCTFENCIFLDRNDFRKAFISGPTSTATNVTVNINNCYFSSFGYNMVSAKGTVLINNSIFKINKLENETYNNFRCINIPTDSSFRIFNSTFYSNYDYLNLVNSKGNLIFEKNSLNNHYSFNLENSGKLSSHTTLTFLNGEDELNVAEGGKLNINATLVDDYGNIIILPELKFTIFGNNFTYNNGVYQTEVSVPEESGNFSIDVSEEVFEKYLGYCTVKSPELIVKKGQNITMNATDMVYGESTNVNVTVSTMESGNITYSIRNSNYDIIKEFTKEFSNNISGAVIDNLDAGTYTLSVTIPETGDYAATTVSKTLTVNKANIVVTVDNTTVDKNITVTVIVPGEGSGKITLRIGRVYVGGYANSIRVINNLDVNSGVNTFSLDPLPAQDDYALGFEFKSSSSNYNDFSNNAWNNAENRAKLIKFKVSKLDSNLNITADNVDWGNNVTVSITTDSRFTGNITVKLGDEEKLAEIKEGSGSVSFADLKADTYNVTAKFNETDMFTSSQKDINVTVNKVNSTLTLGDDIIFDWNKSGTTSVSYAGATGVNAAIDDREFEFKDGVITVSGLAAGNYTLSVTTVADENHTSITRTVNVRVNKVNSTLTLGDDIIFDWNESGTTNVVSYDGATSVEASVDGGVVSVDGNTITVSGLSAGNHTLSVSTVADENHTSITKTVSVKVNKVNATVNLNDIAFDYGSFNSTTFDGEGIKNVTATILNQPDAKIDVSANTITVSGLDAGNYTLEVIVVPDENHNVVTRTVNVTVNKVDSTVDIRNNAVVYDYGDIGYCSIFTEGAVDFAVVIVDHPEAIIKIDEHDIANITGLNAGNYTLKVTTNPDKNHKSVSKTVNVTVNKVDSKLTVPDITFTYGESATVSAVIGNASSIAGVSVVGHPEANVTVNGTSITVSGLTAGTYTLTASTVGDVNYNPVTVNATVTVKGVDVPAAQALSTNVPANSQSPTFSIKLDKDATGNFTVSVDGKVVDTKPLKDGSASITVANLAAGNHKISISYSGDGKYAPITQNTTLTIKAPAVVKKATKIVAKKKTFKAKKKVKKYTITLKSGKTLLKKVKVTLKVKGKTYKATTNNKGKATFKIKNLKKKGTYKAVIKFKGNKNYKASSKKVKIKVKK
ncbi:Ig-like domain repeat protein [uncultured Methanobrevibacter sp.]|uniref:Ig-like domain repeat protein n=1 Tax=uncultured Methanobrevibacter sp. TaxID=253161 RepID=UPI0025DBF915|nr:Ig-like domain repeat protein [uncultured Methanobrevibacter sp.]